MQIVGSKEIYFKEVFQPTSNSKEGKIHWTRFQQLSTTSLEYTNARTILQNSLNLNFWKLVNIFYRLCTNMSPTFSTPNSTAPLIRLYLVGPLNKLTQNFDKWTCSPIMIIFSKHWMGSVLGQNCNFGKLEYPHWNKNEEFIWHDL